LTKHPVSFNLDKLREIKERLRPQAKSFRAGGPGTKINFFFQAHSVCLCLELSMAGQAIDQRTAKEFLFWG